MNAAIAALADLERLRLPDVDPGVLRAIRVAADRAAALLGADVRRDSLLTAATTCEDPVEAAAHVLAAALRGAASEDADGHVATFVGVAAGLVSSAPAAAMDQPGGPALDQLLDHAARNPSREQRLTELFVAGTLVRTTAREVSLDQGLDALAAVQTACDEADLLEVDALLARVYGAVAPEEPGPRAALAGGAVALHAVQRITGGVLKGDPVLQRQGWLRAAALVAELARCAGVPLQAADVRATAARLASDPGLLGRPDATIGDLLTTSLGLQAAVALGGVDDDGPARHLVARLIAHAARCDV